MLKIIAGLVYTAALIAGSIYAYNLVDPRLEIIVLKNEEILQLDNKIATLTDKNSILKQQVDNIASVIKSNENNSGKINDEYKVCLRDADKLKNNNRLLRVEVSNLKNKNEILQEYVQVKNDVTSLQEQIDNLNNEKQILTDQLGPDANRNLDAEGTVIPHQ